MIAIFAIISNALSPEVFSQIQGRPGMDASMEVCHGMRAVEMVSELPVSVMAMATAEEGKTGIAHTMKHHSCCKVCVCHPGATALPAACYLPTFLPASHDAPSPPPQPDIALGIFNTKSSPRGPPLHV